MSFFVYIIILIHFYFTVKYFMSDLNIMTDDDLPLLDDDQAPVWFRHTVYMSDERLD